MTAKPHHKPPITVGEQFADAVARNVGSWRFVIIQSFLLSLWLVANALGWVTWDIYPFILLNLLLSFQAAYTAPFILMSQNRQADIDRDTFVNDFRREFTELKQLHSESKSQLVHLTTLNDTSQQQLTHLTALNAASQTQLDHLDVLRAESTAQLNILTTLTAVLEKDIRNLKGRGAQKSARSEAPTKS